MKKYLNTKIPPPLVTVMCIGIIYLFESKIEYSNYDLKVVGIIFLILGLIIILSAVLKFIKAKTTVDPSRPYKTSNLVMSGIYNITRNPMYLGMLFLIMSYSMYNNNIVGCIVIPIFIFYINKFQIEPEEIEMRRKFGESFENYCKKVNRWL
tara:strand:+ start:1081 stop:1536 length:456 start_codon:yes stop_codon:yes gene_type:complete